MSRDPSAHDLTRQEFTRQARTMPDAPAFTADGTLEPFLRLLEPEPLERVLDLACGPGILTQKLLERGCRVTGVDVTPAMIERARERCLAAGRAAGDDAELRVGTAEELPFADGHFHAIVTRLSIHHFTDPGRVLREARRVLRSGGKLIVGDLTCSADPARAELRNALETLRDPSHRRLFAPEALRALIESAAFAVEHAETWTQPRTFDEWAAVVSEGRSLAPLEVVMRELARAGRDPGIRLREDGDVLRFDYAWLFVRAVAR